MPRDVKQNGRKRCENQQRQERPPTPRRQIIPNQHNHANFSVKWMNAILDLWFKLLILRRLQTNQCTLHCMATQKTNLLLATTDNSYMFVLHTRWKSCVSNEKLRLVHKNNQTGKQLVQGNKLWPSDPRSLRKKRGQNKNSHNLGPRESFQKRSNAHDAWELKELPQLPNHGVGTFLERKIILFVPKQKPS